MALSIFLAKLFGAYLLIVGVICLLRRRSIMKAVVDFEHNRALLLVIAILEILAGLSLVITHNLWLKDFRGVITVLSWWTLIEGVLYLILPMTRIRRMLEAFNKPKWFVSGAVLAIIVGLYLVRVGFGWV